MRLRDYLSNIVVAFIIALIISIAITACFLRIGVREGTSAILLVSLIVSWVTITHVFLKEQTCKTCKP